MDPQLQRLLKEPIFRHGEALTIGYLVALRGYAVPPEMEGVNDEDFQQGLALGKEALESGPAPMFLGYYPDEDLPIRRGQEVTIPAGVKVTYRGETKTSVKTRKVRVDHIISGSNFHVRGRHHPWEIHPITAPKVRWAGSGGYWSEVDINDIPEAIEAAKEAQRQGERQAQSDLIESRVYRLAELLEYIRRNFDASPERWPFQKDGFDIRVHYEKADYFRVDAVADDAVIASFTVDTYVDAGKIVLRINVTSNICQHLPEARLTFKALSLLMAQAEYIDSVYCQPWNSSQ